MQSLGDKNIMAQIGAKSIRKLTLCLAYCKIIGLDFVSFLIIVPEILLSLCNAVVKTSYSL